MFFFFLLQTAMKASCSERLFWTNASDAFGRMLRMCGADASGQKSQNETEMKLRRRKRVKRTEQLSEHVDPLVIFQGFGWEGFFKCNATCPP